MPKVKIDKADKKARAYEATKRWRAKNKEHVNAVWAQQNQLYRDRYPEKVQAKSAYQWKQLRLQAMDVLGGPICVHCGYEDYRALQIDHINGGGKKHIESFTSNKAYLRHIITQPEGFQVLCANCNRIKVYENRELRCRE